MDKKTVVDVTVRVTVTHNSPKGLQEALADLKRDPPATSGVCAGWCPKTQVGYSYGMRTAKPAVSVRVRRRNKR